MNGTVFFKLTQCEWALSGVSNRTLIYVNMRDISTMRTENIGYESYTEITLNNGRIIYVLESLEAIMEMFKEAYK